MSSHLDETIRSLRTKIEDHEAAARKIKVTINQLLELDGKPPAYSDADLQAAPTLLNIRKDQFFGKPLATCVKLILEARGAANQGGATTEELFEILKSGGYDFGSRPGHGLRNLGITIGKNMAFQRTPNGLWGLREWYPEAAKKGRSRAAELGEVADGGEPGGVADGE
jgi:hypothetical protein